MASRFSIAGRSTKKAARRRPTGVSRKQFRRHLQCETLEDRLAFSASSPLAALGDANLEDLGWTVQSFSSKEAEGAAIILANELARQLAIESSADPSVYSTNTVNSLPTDPLFADQWYLVNSGQQVGKPDFQDIFGVPGEDINAAPVWAMGYTGEGVVVAVVDSGVQTAHPDLVANISPTLQLDALTGDNDPNPSLGDGDNPFLPFFASNAHGTSVAGIIAAEWNDIGSAGIAPNATLAPIRLIDLGQTEQAFVDTFRFAIDEIDITNNSWGPAIVRGIAGPSTRELNAIRDSIFFGRDGLGVIHVFSSGNSGLGSDTTSYNGWVNSRYTIGVTGVDHDGFYNNVDGTTTGYPEIGANVLVAAPTGSNTLGIVDDGPIGSGIVTTDTQGDTGFNTAPQDNGEELDITRDFLEDTDYTSQFNGTSASAPMVSGVIALMLEANPNLDWRDVQEILVRSARQNAEFGQAANGADQTVGINFANTWITNQIELFRDPDPWDPTIDPTLQTLSPIADPTLGPTPGTNVAREGFVPTPARLTNGAGYTVSQGYGTNEEFLGYAHGVVDATLAVQLAEQWHTKGQDLPPELTFTTALNVFGGNVIPGAENSNDDSGNQTVPGGLGGESGFIAYWEEYFVDNPFEDPSSFDNERSDGDFILTVPDNNLMTIEHVEVFLDIEGGEAEALDHLRIVLVSPDGTHSDLNHFFKQDFGTESVQLVDFQGSGNIRPIIQNEGDPGSVGSEDDRLVVSFSTNRSWGERSDNTFAFDETTGLPFGDQLIENGWRLKFENWGPTELTVQGFEIAWHGSPILEGTQRISGFVGVDENQDDAFNYSRVFQVQGDIDGDPTALRFNEIENFIDLSQEDFAENVTVIARRASDGVVVDQFVTGHDGNYYFDLIPDDYIISIEDPLGRTAVEDTLSPGGQLQNFRTEWLITEEFFVIPERNPDLTVATDASGVPIPYTTATGAPVEYHVRDINFLLDPGPAAADQVNITGSIFADLNGDGIFNGDDAAAGSIGVFADVNQNGQFDSGEVLVETDATGAYDLTVSNITFTQVINIGVQTPIDWTFGDPSDGLNNILISPGDVISGVDFSIVPPASSAGAGSVNPGWIYGSVFGDENEDGIRQGNEIGLAGVTVYLDNNNSGANDAGDTVTTTNVNGAYSFADVPTGSVNVRVDIPDNFNQIVPIANGSFVANVGGGGTVTGLEFAIRDTADFDYGDLPVAYGGIAASASHTKSSFFLGNTIDGELVAQSSPNADGDDLTGVDDEDGITLSELVPGTNTFTANASRNGGYLQTWIDFNGDGDFDDVFDGGISERVTINEALVAGDNVITFEAPDAATLGSVGPVFARFRYGVFGLNSIGGSSPLGEVEDYMLSVAPAAPPTTFANGPDFDGDSAVSIADLMALQRGFGTTTGATAEMGDADADGDVDAQDMFQWEIEFGSGQVLVAPPQTDADFDQDSDVDLSDLLALQRGFGMDDTALPSDGDATGDADVQADDLDAWKRDFGLGDSNNGGTLGVSTFGPAVFDAVPSPPEADAPIALQAAFDTLGPTRRELFTVAREFANRFDLPTRPIDRVEEAIVDFRERIEDRPFVQDLRAIDLDEVTREEIVDALHGLRDRFRSNLDELREGFRRPGEALDDAFADFDV